MSIQFAGFCLWPFSTKLASTHSSGRQGSSYTHLRWMSNVHTIDFGFILQLNTLVFRPYTNIIPTTFSISITQTLAKNLPLWGSIHTQLLVLVTNLEPTRHSNLNVVLSLPTHLLWPTSPLFMLLTHPQTVHKLNLVEGLFLVCCGPETTF